MGLRALGKVRTGQVTLGKIQDGLRDPRGGLGMVGRPMGKSEMGWETLREVRDGSGDPREGPGQVGRPLGRSGMGRGTLEKVRDGSEESRGGLRWVRGTLGEVCDRSGVFWGGPERAGGPSRTFGTGWGTLGEVWDGQGGTRRVGGPSETSGTGWGDPWGDPGRVERFSRRTGTGL